MQAVAKQRLGDRGRIMGGEIDHRQGLFRDPCRLLSMDRWWVPCGLLIPFSQGSTLASLFGRQEGECDRRGKRFVIGGLCDHRIHAVRPIMGCFPAGEKGIVGRH